MSGLYADENFPFPVIEELRRLGFDVLTMYEDDKANQSLTDEEVLSVASDKKRALLTANRRHFIQFTDDNRTTAASSFAHSIRISSGKPKELRTHWEI